MEEKRNRAGRPLASAPLDIAPGQATSLTTMPEAKNGVVSGGLDKEFTRPRREVERLISDIRASEAGPRLRARLLGARPVVLWLPNTRDTDYRGRLADQCRRLAQLTADEEATAAAFEREAAKTPGWR